jgi:hypothetical protein
VELSEADAVGWLDPIAAAFAGKPGPVPAYASNSMRTLRFLYLLADRGVRPVWNRGDPTPRHDDGKAGDRVLHSHAVPAA